MKAQLLKPLRLYYKLDRRYLLECGLIVLAYVIAAKWGLSLATSTKQVTVVWPPSAIAIVVVLLRGKRYWPSIYAGALIANLMTQEPVLVTMGIAVGNTLEAVIGAFLVRRFTDFKGTPKFLET